VDLLVRVHGTGAGDDLIPPDQGLGPDQLQQQPGHRPIFVPENDGLVGQGGGGAGIEDRALGGDGREQPQLFGGLAAGAGQKPGAEPFDVAAHLLEVGAAGGGAAAVQNETARRGDIPGGPAPQGGVLLEQGLDLGLVLQQGGGVQGV